MNAENRSDSFIHYLALLLAGLTLTLIFIGGLVTSTHSGLSVPDWPLSYGKLMPPMVGGIFFEHGHRMVATFVGFVMVVFAVAALWKEPRRWIKFAAWVGVGLVILQGVLGGLTVLYKLPKPISIAHGCLAQTFFCLTVALAVWTSPAWRRGAAASWTEEGWPLHRVAFGLFGALYVQLVLGAVLRHTGHGVAWHVIGATAVTLFVFWLVGRVLQMPQAGGLAVWTWVLLGVLLTQLALGLGSYFHLASALHLGNMGGVTLVTGHVAMGALLLGVSVVLALWTWRNRAVKVNMAAHPHGRPKFSDYFTLTKPGISFMTGVTALAGFLLASKGQVDVARLFHTVLGTLLVSAGACALNMVMEVDVDARMKRTAARPLPAGRLKPGEALLFGSLLAVAGLIYLSAFVNFLAAFLAGVTLCVYLYLYTPLKKVSSLCVAVGAVSGALPPMMGWAAAAGRLDAGAWVLFGVLFFWQFPHFLALAWIYREDYARAGLSMLPVLEPDGDSTARKIILNSFALLCVSLLPFLLGLAGPAYAAAAFALGLAQAAAGFVFFHRRSILWARRVFFCSIIYLPLLMALMVFSKPTL